MSRSSSQEHALLILCSTGTVVDGEMTVDVQRDKTVKCRHRKGLLSQQSTAFLFVDRAKCISCDTLNTVHSASTVSSYRHMRVPMGEAKIAVVDNAGVDKAREAKPG